GMAVGDAMNCFADGDAMNCFAVEPAAVCPSDTPSPRPLSHAAGEGRHCNWFVSAGHTACRKAEVGKRDPTDPCSGPIAKDFNPSPTAIPYKGNKIKETNHAHFCDDRTSSLSEADGGCRAGQTGNEAGGGRLLGRNRRDGHAPAKAGAPGRQGHRVL